MVLLFREDWMNQRQNWLVFRGLRRAVITRIYKCSTPLGPLLIWFEAAMLGGLRALQAGTRI